MARYLLPALVRFAPPTRAFVARSLRAVNWKGARPVWGARGCAAKWPRLTSFRRPAICRLCRNLRCNAC